MGDRTSVYGQIGGTITDAALESLLVAIETCGLEIDADHKETAGMDWRAYLKHCADKGIFAEYRDYECNYGTVNEVVECVQRFGLSLQHTWGDGGCYSSGVTIVHGDFEDSFPTIEGEVALNVRSLDDPEIVKAARFADSFQCPPIEWCASEAEAKERKYWVSVEESCTYSVPVMARSEDEAKELAPDVLIESDNPNQYFVSCDDRLVGFANLDTEGGAA